MATQIRYSTPFKYRKIQSMFFFPTKSRLLMILKKKPYEKIVGKWENAGNQPFLLFPKKIVNPPMTNFNQSRNLQFGKVKHRIFQLKQLFTK